MRINFKSAFNPKRNGFLCDVAIVVGFTTGIYLGFIQ